MTSINMQISKIPVALMLAGATTLVLFYLMQRLVTTEFVMPEEKSGISIVDISIPEPVLEVVRKQPIPEKMEEPEVLENIAPVITDPNIAGDGIGLYTPEAPEVVPDEISFSVNEGAALVLRQVNPVYPSSALNRGIEGFVVLEFNVNPMGLVEDARVIYGEPEGVFDRSALASLERWRFKPKVENGKEVYQMRERRRIVFSLDN